MSGGNEVSFHSGGFPYHQDPSENEVTFTKPVSATQSRSAQAKIGVTTPSASANRNMSALDANNVTFPITRMTGAAGNPEYVSNASVTAGKAGNDSIQLKDVTLTNAADLVKS